MKHIHIHFRDAFEESKHPRAENGKFGAGGASKEIHQHMAEFHGKEASKSLSARQHALNENKREEAEKHHGDYLFHANRHEFHKSSAA